MSYEDRETFSPNWREEITAFYRGRITREFILHFNINDFVLGFNHQFYTVHEYLQQVLFQNLECQSIYTFSLSNGLTAQDAPNILSDNNLSSVAFKRIQDAWHTLKISSYPSSGKQRENPDFSDTLLDNFRILSHMLRQQYFSTSDTNKSASQTPIAVILDYTEKLIPRSLEDGHGDREQLQILEIIQRWGVDPLIRQTNNIIILLTTNIGQIPSSVYATGSGCRAIRIPLPDAHERETFIKYKMTIERARLVDLDPVGFGSTLDQQASTLARLTQGMRLIDIDNVSRRVLVGGLMRRCDIPDFRPLMKIDDVQRAKSESIQMQSENLLEVVSPTHRFADIGGLNTLKQYLVSRSELMRKGINSPLVPSGILLVGPPGTGKTIIAEALAVESGFNLVKMRNIQDKWVGSSERNLELVINLLKELYPVIVFIDEIDQAIVHRDLGQSGDSGVGARMFARILEEMSNISNRGRVLWVAATNRADIIDVALLRRFDRIIPLLVPGLEETCRIFVSMLNFIVKRSGDSFTTVYGEDLAQSGRVNAAGGPDPTREDLKKFQKIAEITTELGLTGAAIEIIVRRAIELVGEENLLNTRHEFNNQPIPQVGSRHLLAAIKDYKPNYNPLAYGLQTLLAIQACNFHSIIPTLPQTGIFSRIIDANGEIDPIRLNKEIFEIRNKMSIMNNL